MLPDGETRSGEATGVPRVLLNNLYEKGERLKYKDGATAAGKFTQQKRTDITPEQFKEAFGIRPDGTLDNNRKYDGAINALVCLLYTSPSPRDGLLSRMPSSA